MFIDPFFPFDFDSHVVCEILDEGLNKWVMLDPATDGSFADETGAPLSMLEIRNGFLSSRVQTFVPSNGRRRELQKAKSRYERIHLYMMKNCFRNVL